jgi:hypothetical protein
MSYAGLGAHYEVKVAGIGIPVDVPLEQVANDAITAASASAQAQLPAMLDKQVPLLLKSAVPQLQEALKPQLRLIAFAAASALVISVGVTIMSAHWVKKG